MRRFWLAASLVFAWNSPTCAATAQQPAVLELFTSQGCSSCPPADANLLALADRPDVLALSFNVTYWDHLGWKDTFGKPEFTQRQADYEAPLHENEPFTPQIVMDGSADTVGIDRGAIEKLIAASHRDHAPTLQLANGKVSLGAASRSGQIWLVRYDPRAQRIPVGAGENDGATLAQKNIVRTLTLLGDWNGAAKDFALPAEPPGLKTAVLVQSGRGGPILAVVRN